MKLRIPRLVASAAMVALAGAAVICLDATAAGANPGISVSPSTGLHNGQTVTVTGSGFTKNGTVYIVECKAGATAEGQCSFTFSDLSTVVVAKADASGNLHSPSPALKSSFKTTDCTKVACEIAAHQTLSTQLSATNTAVHAIAFGTAAHPTTSHSTASTTAHTSGASTGASTHTSASPTASTTSSTSSSTSGKSPTTVGASATAGNSASTSGTASSSAPPQKDETTAAAKTVKLKAKNGGRYLLVGIVAVLAVLYIASMAISGRRAARR